MRIAIIIIILVSFFQLNGQKTDLFVKNASESKGSIELRIYTEDLKNTNGINIYRKTEGTDWQKVNTDPIKLTTVNQLDASFDEEQKQFIEILNSKTTTDDGIIKLVLIQR